MRVWCAVALFALLPALAGLSAAAAVPSVAAVPPIASAEIDHLNTAEDFIRLAASESSMSHKPYQVRCGSEQLPSAVWFGEELQRFRQKTGAKGR